MGVKKPNEVTFGGPDDGRPYVGGIHADGVQNKPANRQYIRITSPDLKHPIECLLGATTPSLTGGGGGFEKVERARKIGMTRWKGFQGYTYTIEVMLDNMRGLDQMNPQQLLDRILKVYRNPDEEEPSPVRLYGRALALSGWKWVLNDIAWGTTVRDQDGRLKRQVLTLTFEEYVKSRNLKFKRRKKQTKPHKPEKYTVKKGDTLYSIAKKFYDDRDKWKKIAERNDLRGPRSIKVGDVLIIP